MSNGPDLAELSVRIDTSDAKTGVTELTKLGAAAEKTEAATKKTETATELYAKSLERMVKEVNETNEALARMRTVSKDLETMGEAATALQAAFRDTSGLERFHTRLGALDAATGRLQASFTDTSAVSRFMGELSKATMNLSKMQAEHTRAAGAVQEMKRAVEDTEKPVNRLSQGLGGLLTKVAGFAALSSALRSATSEALAFNTAMAQISTLLEGDQLQMMGTLTEQAKALGAEFGRVPTEQAKALYEIMSAGASDATQATELLRVANKLAIGGVTEVGVAADGLTSIMASYGAQIRDATVAADAMFVSAADGKTSIEQIARHIGKLAPIASQVGVSLQELLAANAALTKAGIKTETAMEGLRSILAQVAKPSNEARDLARALGIEFTTAGLKAKGLAGFLADITERTQGSTDQLAMLVGGVEALLPAMTLSGSGAADFANSLRNMETAAGRTETAFLRMADTPQMKLDQLHAKFVALQTEVGDGVLAELDPVMSSLLQNFDAAATAVGYLAQGMAILTAMKAASWAQEWTKGLLDKAAAVNRNKDAVTKAALAEAGYVRMWETTRQGALRAALATLEQRQAALQSAAALEGPFTVAHTRAALASNALAQAKVREAIAVAEASVAARAGAAALSMLGGPIGVVTMALGVAISAFFEFGRAADEAREKARQFAQESGASANKGSQIIVDLVEQTRALQDQTRAMEAFTIAKGKMAALGGKYQDRLTEEVDTIQELAAAYESVARIDLADAEKEIDRLNREVKDMQNRIMTVNHKWGLADIKDFKRARQDPRFRDTIEKRLVPLEKDLAAQQQRAAEIKESLAKMSEAVAAASRKEAAAAVTLTQEHKVAAEAAQKSGKEILDELKAREQAAERAEEWVLRLEEEARGAGLSREAAMRLTDQYAKLTDVQKKRADEALRIIETSKAAAKADEERKRIVEELNRELGDSGAAKYAQAQRILREELDKGKLSAKEYQDQLAKARTLWTKEGKAEAQLVKDMELLQRQLNPLEEVRKRVEMLNKLLDEERISMEAYQKEMVRLHSQMSDGFSLARDAMMSATNAMEDAFVTFATTGKFEFREMVNSILKDIARLLAHKAFTAFVDMGTSALLGGVTGASFASGGAAAGGVTAGKSAFDMSAPAVMKSGSPLVDGPAKLVTPVVPTGATSMALPAGAVPPINVNVHVHQDGSVRADVQAPGTTEESRRLGQHLGRAVRRVMLEEMRPGGFVYDFVNRRR
ncbi:phage tail tape measure protein [Myxococcus sp. Y35]|uniref:phage tail tape measure protein n=1 Tax=Pseudomyxococcus flavus TaxID=3115648 RepID=UPI003CED05F5